MGSKRQKGPGLGLGKIGDETYRTPVICYNCDFKGQIDIPKGTQVKETPCPKCGNKTLRRALPGEVT